MRFARRWLLLLSLVTLTVSAVGALGAALPTPVSSPPAVYLLRLTDPPLARYDGGLPGLPATAATGSGRQRLDLDAPAAQAYRTHLRQQQDTVLAGLAALLPNGDGGLLSVSGPAQVPLEDPFSLRLAWQLATGAPGSYAALLVSGDPADPWRHSWLRLTRLSDDVEMRLASPTAGLGQSIGVTATIAPHPGWVAAVYQVTVTLPPGLTPLPGSATGGAVITAQSVTWAPTLPRDGPAAAAGFTVRVNDVVCRQPLDALPLSLQITHTTLDPAAQEAGATIILTAQDLQADCDPYLLLPLTLQRP
jgi:hypothetical protein